MSRPLRRGSKSFESGSGVETVLWSWRLPNRNPVISRSPAAGKATSQAAFNPAARTAVTNHTIPASLAINCRIDEVLRFVAALVIHCRVDHFPSHERELPYPVDDLHGRDEQSSAPGPEKQQSKERRQRNDREGDA